MQCMLCTLNMYPNMMIPSHNPETYEQQALDMLPLDHPHYDEIKDLIEEQIEDDMDAYIDYVDSTAFDR